MNRPYRDTAYAEHLFAQFYDIGSTSEGGVTRLGYSAAEDDMMDAFLDMAEAIHCPTYIDEVGNCYASNSAAGRSGESEPYYLIGSHLDSVVDGGRYDGVAGVIAGLMALHWAASDCLSLPIRAAAFRCEESSNFDQCTIGSGLVTKKLLERNVKNLTAKDGTPLRDIFAARGYSMNPPQIRGVRQYLELHIEQGRVLEENRRDVGIVQSIAGPRRFTLQIRGVAEHSGATPMDMRNDALCAAAEIILAVEKLGIQESARQSVITVGKIRNSPNVLNVVPGEVVIGIDARSIYPDSLDLMEASVRDIAADISRERKVAIFMEKISDMEPCAMTPSIQDALERTAAALGISSMRMMSGAGHDAMCFAPICDTAMLFIPCEKGISHNRKEFAEIESICLGARVFYEYLKGECAR